MTLQTIKAVLNQQPNFDNTMLWEACCMGVFRFMRCGEFTVPSEAAYDSSRHLSVRDTAVDSHTAPTMVAITLRHSKTDQFKTGATIHLGQTSNFICLVHAILQYYQ